jgi:hypothetical protein
METSFLCLFTQLEELLFWILDQELFGRSFCTQGIRAFFCAPSLLQCHYPALDCAYDFTLRLPSGLFLAPGFQVLQFLLSAFDYFHNRIHDTFTTLNCLAVRDVGGFWTTFRPKVPRPSFRVAGDGRFDRTVIGQAGERHMTTEY